MLGNDELAQLFGMRCDKLKGWLSTASWSPALNVSFRTVYYDEARSLSRRVMECLVEIEARAMPNSKWDVPYLADTLNQV